ncbi:EpsG family protein [Shewanella xiamenensis]|uniref:EpsG family protein n=1 Tax=Shewanella xiamenensis TaxID=332186 RepID=UPI00313E33F5
MITYLFPVFYSYLFALSTFFKKELKFSLSILVCCTVVIVSGLRYFSDTDYPAYYDIFVSLPKLQNLSASDIQNTYGEVGYLYLNVIVKSLGFEFFVVTIVSAFISIFGKFFFVKKLCYSTPLVLTCYLAMHFVTTEFSELRWSVATGFSFMAFCCFYYRKYYSVAFFFSLAVLFHYSTLLLFPIVFIKRIPIKYIFIIFTFSFILALSYKFFAFSISLDLNSSFYALARLQRYLNDPDSNVGFISLGKLVFYMSILFAMDKVSRGRNYDEISVFLYKVALCVASIGLCLSIAPVFFLRLAPVFDLVFLSLIFREIALLKIKSNRLFFSFIVIFLFSLWQLIALPRSLSVPLEHGGLGQYQSVVF